MVLGYVGWVVGRSVGWDVEVLGCGLVEEVFWWEGWVSFLILCV